MTRHEIIKQTKYRQSELHMYLYVPFTTQNILFTTRVLVSE